MHNKAPMGEPSAEHVELHRRSERPVWEERDAYCKPGMQYT